MALDLVGARVVGLVGPGGGMGWRAVCGVGLAGLVAGLAGVRRVWGGEWRAG